MKNSILLLGRTELFLQKNNASMGRVQLSGLRHDDTAKYPILDVSAETPGYSDLMFACAGVGARWMAVALSDGSSSPRLYGGRVRFPKNRTFLELGAKPHLRELSATGAEIHLQVVGSRPHWAV